MIEIRLSETAKEDFMDIWISTQARWGEAQTYSYLDDLDRALRLLADNPLNGASAQYPPSFGSCMNVQLHGSFPSLSFANSRFRICR